MNGGGPWNLCPGQITDDSELALCLMKGLLESVTMDHNLKVLERRSIQNEWFVRILERVQHKCRESDG